MPVKNSEDIAPEETTYFPILDVKSLWNFLDSYLFVCLILHLTLEVRSRKTVSWENSPMTWRKILKLHAYMEDFNSSYDLCLLGSLILSCTCHSWYNRRPRSSAQGEGWGTSTATSHASYRIVQYLPSAVRKKLLSGAQRECARPDGLWQVASVLVCVLRFSLCKHRCVLGCETAV